MAAGESFAGIGRHARLHLACRVGFGCGLRLGQRARVRGGGAGLNVGQRARREGVGLFGVSLLFRHA